MFSKVVTYRFHLSQTDTNVAHFQQVYGCMHSLRIHLFYYFLLECSLATRIAIIVFEWQRLEDEY